MVFKREFHGHILDLLCCLDQTLHCGFFFNFNYGHFDFEFELKAFCLLSGVDSVIWKRLMCLTFSFN